MYLLISFCQILDKNFSQNAGSTKDNQKPSSTIKFNLISYQPQVNLLDIGKVIDLNNQKNVSFIKKSTWQKINKYTSKTKTQK